MMRRMEDSDLPDRCAASLTVSNVGMEEGRGVGQAYHAEMVPQYRVTKATRRGFRNPVGREPEPYQVASRLDSTGVIGMVPEGFHDRGGSRGVRGCRV